MSMMWALHNSADIPTTKSDIAKSMENGASHFRASLATTRDQTSQRGRGSSTTLQGICASKQWIKFKKLSKSWVKRLPRPQKEFRIRRSRSASLRLPSNNWQIPPKRRHSLNACQLSSKPLMFYGPAQAMEPSATCWVNPNRGASDMLDPEAFLVKGTIITLAMFTALRLVLREYNNLVSDLRKSRRRR